MLKNNRKHIFWLITACFCVLSAFIAFAAPSYSEFWYVTSDGNWHVRDGNGNTVKNAWLCDDAVASNGKDIWYLLDADGNMVSAGLVQDKTGNYYSLEMNHDGYYGMLRYRSGSYTADGLTVDLQLESQHNGSFAAIKNQDGIEKLKARYGLQLLNIDNSNCVYTSSFGNSSASQSAQTVSGTLTAEDFKASGASVSNTDLKSVLDGQGSDTTVYFFYDSSSDPSRSGVVKTARGITLESTKTDVLNAYGSGKAVSVSDPAGTKVLRAAYGADPNGVNKFLKSCLAYFTADGSYAIYFGFKDNGQLSFIFYHKV